MTTGNTHNIVYTSFLLLSLSLLPWTVLAQDNTPASSESVVASSTEGNGSVQITETDKVVEAKPWFKVEKLNGDNVQQGDFVVGPGRAELEIRPGESVIYEISVANRISDGRVFDLAVEDIGGTVDGSESVVLFGDERGPYTVKDYFDFPEDSFELALGERARIPVTITIPPDAEPGGYYGSVLVSTVRTNEAEQVDASVPRSPIIARIGTLFFITVPGDIETSGETKEISLANKKWWYESGPIDFNILYENTGSVHLGPYGELRIKNLFGEEVGYVELDPWFVLPKSLRTRDVSWDRELLLGRYVATAQINRGYDNIVDEVSVVFWVLPWKIVGGTFLVIFIIIFSIRAFFRKFEFKRKD